ncbi:MAG TPA: archease [Terriglobia bacterium]|nr:archease [Terriglobia bacterium]
MITIGLKALPPGVSGCSGNYFEAFLPAHDAMSRFRILEHTADVGFEAFGSTLPEAFENAARAMAHLVVDPAAARPVEETQIKVPGTDPPDLLVNWLSEILYRHDAERCLFHDFRVESIDDHAASGIARIETIDPARHRTNLMVKAITFHQLGLQQTAGGWRAQVYVDI